MRVSNTLTLPDDIKQTILWYLENYWQVIAAIANQKNEVFFGGVMKDLDVPIHSTNTSDITSKKALLFTDFNLCEMAGWIRVINSAYKYFLEKDKDKANLLWYSFIYKTPEKKTKTKVIDSLHLSRDRYYKWLDSICGIIAVFAAGRKLIDLEVEDKAV